MFEIIFELVPPIEIVNENKDKCLIIACGKSFGQETFKILRNVKEEYWFKKSIDMNLQQPFADKFPGVFRNLCQHPVAPKIVS